MTIKIKIKSSVVRSGWEMKNGFTMIPNFVLQSNLGIDSVSKSVLLTLLSRARWGGRPTVTVTTLPTSYSVFEKSGLYRNSIAAALRNLRDAKFVKSNRASRRSPAVYTIYLSAIEAAALQSTRATTPEQSTRKTTQRSTRATATPTEQSTRATTEQSTRATTTKEDTQVTKDFKKPTNQQAGRFGEDWVDEKGVRYLHPSAIMYDIATLQLSPGVEDKYGDAEALVVAGLDQFFVCRNRKGSPTRLIDGAWTLVNRYSGKCADCGTNVAKGMGIYRDSEPLCSDHFEPEELVLGVGSFEEYVRLLFTEEEIISGDFTVAYDHVRFAQEAIR